MPAIVANVQPVGGDANGNITPADQSEAAFENGKSTEVGEGGSSFHPTPGHTQDIIQGYDQVVNQLNEGPTVQSAPKTTTGNATDGAVPVVRVQQATDEEDSNSEEVFSLGNTQLLNKAYDEAFEEDSGNNPEVDKATKKKEKKERQKEKRRLQSQTNSVSASPKRNKVLKNFSPSPIGDERVKQKMMSLRSQSDLSDGESESTGLEKALFPPGKTHDVSRTGDIIGTSQQAGPSYAVSYAAATTTASIETPSEPPPTSLPRPKVTPTDRLAAGRGTYNRNKSKK